LLFETNPKVKKPDSTDVFAAYLAL